MITVEIMAKATVLTTHNKNASGKKFQNNGAKSKTKES